MKQHDVSDCMEAHVGVNGRDIRVCPCGVPGVLIKRVEIRDGERNEVRIEFRHNFAILPIITFEPEAVAVVGSRILGPGLHRAIERQRFVEHQYVGGVLIDAFEEISTIQW